MAQLLIGNVKGPQGNTGATGATGPQGEAATINVGSVSTTAYGNAAQVVNVGTENDAVLNFVIPQGKPGQATTTMGGLTLDTITTSTASFPSPQVGDTGATAFGKIVKFFADALSALNSKLNAANVVNNLTTTESGYALDARAGKTLNDSLTTATTALADVNKELDFKSGGTSYTFTDNWRVAQITVITQSGQNNFRCETTILRADVNTNGYYHYLGGYLTATNCFGASVVITPTSASCAGAYLNGSAVASGGYTMALRLLT